MNYKRIIQSIYEEVKAMPAKGKLANYIPHLAEVKPNKLGVHITMQNGLDFGVGDYEEGFSMQSVTKVLSLSLAYKLKGESLWERVGVEPSGTSFNSLTQLEADKGIPRNPFINAGALVICDFLVSELKNPETEFLAFCRDVADDESINYDANVCRSEREVGFRNVALCNFVKSFGNIKNEPARVLDFYFSMCSMTMSCQQLSKAFLFLADDQFRLPNGEQVLEKKMTHRINALMLTCGFYDESGEFCFRVGLAGKSGVGGGVIAVSPDNYSIAVWSPLLNEKGNSYKGIQFLERFTSETDSSVF